MDYEITIPIPALILPVAPAGAGKSTFLATHFRPSQIVSSDHCRAIICDDEANQTCSGDAFALLHQIVEMRLKRGRLTVVDATNLKARDRKEMFRLAEEHGIPVVALVFAYEADVYRARNAGREGRQVPAEAIARHIRLLTQAVKDLPGEGFAAIYTLSEPDVADRVQLIFADARAVARLDAQD